MNSEGNKRVVLGAWEMFKTRDPKRIAAMFAVPDAEWLAPANNATAVALNGPSHMVGQDEIGRLIGQEIWKLFTANVAIDFRSVYADGNVVIIEQRMRATLASGNAYDNDYCFVFEVKDGLVHRVREIWTLPRGTAWVFRRRLTGPEKLYHHKAGNSLDSEIKVTDAGSR